MKKNFRQHFCFLLFKRHIHVLNIALLILFPVVIASKCSGQGGGVIISSGGHHGSIDCAPSMIDVQVDNPNFNYNYNWRYVFFDSSTCIYNNSGPVIANGANALISAEVGEFFGIYCSADSAGIIVDDSHWLKIRRPGFKVRACTNFTNACGEKDLILPNAFLVIDSTAAVLNMQWFKNGVPTTLSGFSPPFMVTLPSTGVYYLRVQVGNCGFAYSDSIYVTVNKPSASVTPSGALSLCQGESVLLNAAAAANRTYQWKRGGNLIAGATSSTYPASTAGNYRVIVTNTVTGCSKTTTSPTIVTVNPVPPATVTPQGPTTFCAGGSVLLKGNFGASFTYQWKKGGNDIPGATAKNYTATIAGTYKIKVTNSYGCAKLSTGVTVTVPCRENENVKTEEWESAFDVKIFPNPTHAEINIVLSQEDNFEIEIVNTLGEKMIKAQNQKRVDISNFSNGIYFIKVNCADRIVTQKFIKQ